MTEYRKCSTCGDIIAQKQWDQHKSRHKLKKIKSEAVEVEDTDSSPETPLNKSPKRVRNSKLQSNVYLNLRSRSGTGSNKNDEDNDQYDGSSDKFYSFIKTVIKIIAFVIILILIIVCLEIAFENFRVFRKYANKVWDWLVSTIQILSVFITQNILAKSSTLARVFNPKQKAMNDIAYELFSVCQAVEEVSKEKFPLSYITEEDCLSSFGVQTVIDFQKNLFEKVDKGKTVNFDNEVLKLASRTQKCVIDINKLKLQSFDTPKALRTELENTVGKCRLSDT